MYLFKFKLAEIYLMPFKTTDYVTGTIKKKTFQYQIVILMHTHGNIAFIKKSFPNFESPNKRFERSN